jgi:hypothetical protein
MNLEYIKKIENNYKNMLAIENEKTKQIEIECNRDIKVAEENRKTAEANAKQAEENRKTAEENKQTKQIELEIIKETKIIKESKNKNNAKNINKNINNNNVIDLYLNFINECTEESTIHIHYTTLYEAFKEWFKNKNCDSKIPTYMTFSKGMKPHTGDSKVRVNNIVLMGAKNLKLKKIYE